jgi:hypothetical protein
MSNRDGKRINSSKVQENDTADTPYVIYTKWVNLKTVKTSNNDSYPLKYMKQLSLEHVIGESSRGRDYLLETPCLLISLPTFGKYGLICVRRCDL